MADPDATEPADTGPGAVVAGGGVAGGGGAPLRVTDEHMNAALDELLDTRNQLTRVLLGAPSRPRGLGPGGRRSSGAAGADAVIPDPGDPSSGWPLRR